MTARQILVGATAWVLAVGSVATLSWVAIDSAGHDVSHHGVPTHVSRPVALPRSPSATAPTGPRPTPNVPESSPPVVRTTVQAVSATSPVAPRRTTQRNRPSPGPDRSTSRTQASWSSGDVRTDGDDVGRWLASVAPDGVLPSDGPFAAGVVPGWYGDSASDSDDDGDDDGDGRDGWSGGDRSAGSGSDDLDPRWTSRTLDVGGGLVWADCDGTRLDGWSVTPRDGWSARAGLRWDQLADQPSDQPSIEYLEARFRSRGGDVSVQAACVDSRPVFRFRDDDSGAWRTSVR